MGKIEIGRVPSKRNSKGYKIAWDADRKRGWMLSNGGWSDIGEAKRAEDVPSLAMNKISKHPSSL